VGGGYRRVVPSADDPGGTSGHAVTVTGGAGYLGEHVVKLLLGVGWRVRVLDAAERPSWTESLDVEYLQGDVRDPDMVTRAVRGASSVVHTAFASPGAADDDA